MPRTIAGFVVFEVLRQDIVCIQSHGLTNIPYDLLQRLTCWRIGKVVEETLSEVAAHTNPGIQRHSTKERNTSVFSQLPTTTSRGPEDL